MSPFILSGVYFSSLFFSSALVLAPSTLQSNAQRPPYFLTGPLLPRIATNINSPSSKVLCNECDGREFSRSLKESSCRELFRDKGTGGYKEVTFRQRHTGPRDDWLLHIRWSSDDGLYYVQSQLRQGCLTASASFMKTREAAYTLFLAWLIDRRVGELPVPLVRL